MVLLVMIRDIYSYDGLREVELLFNGFMKDNLDPSFHSDEAIRSPCSNRDNDLIVRSIILERFLTQIFPIEKELEIFHKQAELWEILSEFKLQFVQRRALRKYSSNDVKNDWNLDKFDNLSINKFALQVLDWLKNEEQYEEELESAQRYVAYKAYKDPDHSVFILPKKLDFENLIDVAHKPCPPKNSFSEANYCIYCHNQEKDYCRKGIDEKTNPLGNKLSGCPLGQKISEMNYLYSKGHIIAALAVTMIDNPLVAATGKRVCNDCMKSCIYQKQEPVDIPCIETEMLQYVLTLPYGAEIYYLLSRWNPLGNYMAIENASGKVFVAGLGPAGFAMSYYLLRMGHKVTAIDGMKISKLDTRFFSPISNWRDLVGEYKPQGFGGVSEYGITDRWDKSNLLLIRMILERFSNFDLIGNNKLGKDITLKAAACEYDYVALCLGAGEPNLPEIKNIDAKGVYSAFDFLMEVNVGLNPLDKYINMPVIVIGAGLTAIDCAMEALRYGNVDAPDVTILYRKSMRDSPSYRENHEELQIAMDSGVKFVENIDLKSIELDEKGCVKSINETILAKSIIFAFGTGYNDGILRDEADIAGLYRDKIGIFGDLDPIYCGSVVKAIASSKDAYEDISKTLSS